MASIGNIAASLLSTRAENTNAIANFNIELNLFTQKITPPREYSGVGLHLAPSRIKEAQDGIRHTIARKLGLLFKGVIPPTPNLIKAYGSRASEIAESSSANPRGDKTHGVFSGTIGADATTLWAAATSGRPAIACHLLACMLARIWDPAEATSIWVEIVTQRKDLIRAKAEEEGEVEQEVAMVVSQSFNRSDLADWDASARAWLRVADSVMAKKQIQLRLILDNLDLPVNSASKAYDSVLEAWISAMKQMERLLGGEPLQLTSGDICLGLSSWHLFPDMICLSSPTKTIKQNDALFGCGGPLTIGLEASPARRSKSVYWSLPLAHMRYYGLPVTKTRSISTSECDRITIDEWLWAITCAYIEPLNDGSVSTQELLKFFADFAVELHFALCRVFPKKQSRRGYNQRSTSSSWLLMLAKTALKFYHNFNEERHRRLRNLGRLYSGNLPPVFHGILTPDLGNKARLGTESKLSHWRYLWKDLWKDLWNDVLLKHLYKANVRVANLISETPYLFLASYKIKFGNTELREYATLLPERNLLGKNPDSPEDDEACHRRWITTSLPQLSTDTEQEVYSARMSEIQALGETADLGHAWFPYFKMDIRKDGSRSSPDAPDCHGELFVIVEKETVYAFEPIFGSVDGLLLLSRSQDPEVCLRAEMHRAVRPIVMEKGLYRSPSAEALALLEAGGVSPWPRSRSPSMVRRRRRRGRDRERDDGDCESDRRDRDRGRRRYSSDSSPSKTRRNTAPFIRRRRLSSEPREHLIRRQRGRSPSSDFRSDLNDSHGQNSTQWSDFNTRRLIETFLTDARRLDFDIIAKQFEIYSTQDDGFLAMSFVDRLYRNFDNATVDVRAVQYDLENTRWMAAARKEHSLFQARDYGVKYYPVPWLDVAALWPRSIDIGICLSCIALMETGSFDLDPAELGNAFALASTDSLFVVSKLLEDPAQRPTPSPIRRFTGNIGKAGFAILVPPAEPMVREFGVGDWYRYDHKPFDGIIDDCFTGTSLHLSFSEATFPLRVGSVGGRDIEAFFIETLVSVYDCQTWIAEINISKTFACQRLVTEYLPCPPCKCDQSCSPSRSPMGAQHSKFRFVGQLISVDSFAEMIVPPSRPGIIRAKGNWQARLAAAAVCIAKGYIVVLKPEGVCCRCFLNFEAKINAYNSARDQTVNDLFWGGHAGRRRQQKYMIL